MQVANGGGFGLWPRYNCEDITMARIRVNDIGSGAVRVCVCVCVIVVAIARLNLEIN